MRIAFRLSGARLDAAAFLSSMTAVAFVAAVSVQPASSSDFAMRVPAD